MNRRNPGRILVVDDDSNALEMIKYHLESSIPEIDVELREYPHIETGYDVYIIDNEFHGEPLAEKLAQVIRALSPNSLIVAWSGCLDGPTLRRLINFGCHGACDKSEPKEIEGALSVIRQFLLNRPDHLGRSGTTSLIQSITALLREWNRRLLMEQRSH